MGIDITENLIDFLLMRFFRILTIGIALLLTLIGNTTVVGFCLSEGTFSLAGINTCEPAETLCPCNNCPSGDYASENDTKTHTELAVELDSPIRDDSTKTDAPAVEELSLCCFFEILSARIRLDLKKSIFRLFPPPDSGSAPARVKLAGTLPLLA